MSNIINTIVIKGNVKNLLNDELKKGSIPYTISNCLAKNEMMLNQTEDGFVVSFTHLKARCMKHLHIFVSETDECTVINVTPELQPIIYKVYMIIPCIIWLLFGIVTKSIIAAIILILAQVVFAKIIIFLFQNVGVKRQVQLLSVLITNCGFEIIKECEDCGVR